MSVSPRRMARLKAEFREGQANYNHLVRLQRVLKTQFKQLNRLEKERKRMVGNLHHAIQGTTEIYNNPSQTHRMMLLWHARERKLQQKYNQKRQEINLHVRRMRPHIRNYYTRRYGNINNQNTNNNIMNVVRNNIKEHIFSPKRMARLKLARLINVAATRPGGWVSKRLFTPGNQPRAAA